MSEVSLFQRFVIAARVHVYVQLSDAGMAFTASAQTLCCSYTCNRWGYIKYMRVGQLCTLCERCMCMCGGLHERYMCVYGCSSCG